MLIGLRDDRSRQHVMRPSRPTNLIVLHVLSAGMFSDIRNVVVHELQSKPDQLVRVRQPRRLQQERRVAHHADVSQSTRVQLRLLSAHEVL